jgi:hypothetical protein
MAVGSIYNGTTDAALAEYWNGSTWTIKEFPKPAPHASVVRIAPISCISATSCIAVGLYRLGGACHEVTDGWNGTSWTVLSTRRGQCGPRNTGPQAISCVTAADCIAVGDAYAERWNGSTWTTQTLPSLPAGPELDAVSCASAASCTAAGSRNTSAGFAPVAEHWNGSKWAVEPTPASPAPRPTS